MTSKKKQQSHHFYQRQKQRLPTDTTNDDVVKLINIQLGVVVRKQSHRVTLWAVYLHDDFYIFPFDKNTKQVMTVLPQSSEYYELLREAFFKNQQHPATNWCEQCGLPLQDALSVSCICCSKHICKSCIANHYRQCVIGDKAWKKIIKPGRPLVCQHLTL